MSEPLPEPVQIAVEALQDIVSRGAPNRTEHEITILYAACEALARIFDAIREQEAAASR